MLYSTLLLNIIIFSCGVGSSDQDTEKSDDDETFGASLISKLKDDANLDLSVDEEYEDLRAELLAYHTALADLTSTRRGMVHRPCWQLGGVCVNYKMCSGFRYLTEVPGCRNNLNVCCFTWNRYKVRDFVDQGLGSVGMPWTQQQEFGGEGIKIKSTGIKKLKKTRPRVNKTGAVAFTVKTRK